jgi:hypothetical protein
LRYFFFSSNSLKDDKEVEEVCELLEILLLADPGLSGRLDHLVGQLSQAAPSPQLQVSEVSTCSKTKPSFEILRLDSLR